MTHTHQQTYLAKLGFADKDRQNIMHDIACQYLAQPEKAMKLFELVCNGPDKKLDLYERGGEQVVCEDYLINPADFQEQFLKPLNLTSEQFLRYSRKIEFFLSHQIVSSEWQLYQANLSEPIRRFDFRGNSSIVGYCDVEYLYGVNAQVEYGLNARYDMTGYRSRPHDFAPIPINFFDVRKIVTDFPRLKPELENRIFRFNRGNRQSRETETGQRIIVEVKATRVSASEVIQQIGTYRELDYFTAHYVLATCYQQTENEKELLRNQGIHSIYLSPDILKAYGQSLVTSAEKSF